MSHVSTDVEFEDQHETPSLLLVDQTGLLTQLQTLNTKSSVLRLNGPARDATIKLVINELTDELILIDHHSRFPPAPAPAPCCSIRVASLIAKGNALVRSGLKFADRRPFPLAFPAICCIPEPVLFGHAFFR